MDWSRAKSVLILAFLVLNIMLGYQLWMDELNLSNFSKNAAKREEMSRLLDLKNIQLQTMVPEAMPVLNDITVSLQVSSQEMEWQPLDRPIPVTVLSDQAQLLSALQQQLPMVDEYETDRRVPGSSGTMMIMNQLYDGLPMFPIKLELSGQGSLLTLFRVLYVKVEPAEGEEPIGQEVLSAYTVLGNLAEYYLPQDSVVTDIRLGYHGPIFESETQVLAPYWRVMLKTGETYYVHAVTGAVEGPPA